MSLIETISRTGCVAEIARSMLPASVAVAQADPQLETDGVHPKEQPVMVNMVQARKREYAAGRVAARNALAQLSITDSPVLTGHDRAPIWPAGTVGSITHSEMHCLAAVGRKCDIHSIGIDIEPNTALTSDLIHEVCTADEIAWLDNQPNNKRPHLARLIFSAKECTYKCQYPLTQQLMPFHALQINLNQITNSFQAMFMSKTGQFQTGDCLHGHFYTDHSIILTAMVMNQVAHTDKEF